MSDEFQDDQGTGDDQGGDQTQADEAARIAELEAKAARAEELEAQLKEREEELAKEREKEKNFSKVREAAKGKTSKIEEEFGRQIAELKTQIEKEREERQGLHGIILGNAKKTALDQLAGDNKELRAKLELRVKDSEAYMGAPKDDKELIERYEKAFAYESGNRKKVNPLYAFSPVTGVQNTEPGKKTFTQTPEGDAMFKRLFPKAAEAEERAKKKN